MYRLVLTMFFLGIEAVCSTSINLAQEEFDKGNFLESAQLFQNFCEQGDSVSCKELAYMHMSGNGLDVDKEKSIFYFKRAFELSKHACENGDSKQCFAVGLEYLYDLDYHVIPMDLEKAYRYFNQACIGNSIEACNSIVEMIQDKKIFKKDPKEAQKTIEKIVHFYNVSCQDGDMDSCLNLGKMHYKGVGLEQDKEKAYSFFKTACEKGNGKSCNKVILYTSWEDDYSDNQKLWFYEKGCDKNDSDSCKNLGNAYHIGLGVGNNPKKAFAYYDKACSLNAGNCSSIGKNLEKKNDITHAVQYYDEGCKRSSGSSCEALGKLYDNHGNKQIAAQLYLKACDLDKKNACKEIGNIFNIGYASINMPKNHQKALDYYTKSCAIENSDICLDRCELYEVGDAIVQNTQKAFECYQNICMNAKEDDYRKAKACVSLGRQYLDGRGTRQDYKAAFQFFTKYDANAYLGQMYENGFYVKKDLNKALSYYAKDDSIWTQEESKKNYSRLDAQINHLTQLFGISLVKATRKEIWNALYNTKVIIKRQDASYWGDIYETNQVLEGSSELSIIYTSDNKFAVANYTFPSRLDLQQIDKIKNMVVTKYGQPIQSQGSALVGEVSYLWKLQDGIELKVYRGWPDTTTYMKYTYPKNYKIVLEQQKLQEEKEKEKQYKSQHNAF